MTSHPPVTANDLRSDPELAILYALGHTIELAIYALVASYPLLTDSERPDWRPEDSAAGRAARHIIASSQELECAILGYRTAILSARHAEANQDLPF